MKPHFDLEILDLEILVIPVAITCALTFLVPRRVGLLGVLPVAALAMLVAAVPLAVRASDPDRRAGPVAYVGVNLLATLVVVSAFWLVRSGVLSLLPA